LPVNEGGHGLMDIQSRIKIFRIQAMRRLLNSGESMGTDTTCALLQKSGHFYSKYDKQLFLIQQSSDRSQGTKSEELKIFNGKILTYQSIRFENWQKLKKSRGDVLKSVRLMKIILNRIFLFLPSALRQFQEANEMTPQNNEELYKFADLKIYAAIEEQQEKDSILNFRTPQLITFEETSKKAIYVTHESDTPP